MFRCTDTILAETPKREERVIRKHTFLDHWDEEFPRLLGDFDTLNYFFGSHSLFVDCTIEMGQSRCYVYSATAIFEGPVQNFLETTYDANMRT